MKPTHNFPPFFWALVALSNVNKRLDVIKLHVSFHTHKKVHYIGAQPLQSNHVTIDNHGWGRKQVPRRFLLNFNPSKMIS